MNKQFGVYDENGILIEDNFNSIQQAEIWANERGYENYTVESY
jgi:hypothetical protein